MPAGLPDSSADPQGAPSDPSPPDSLPTWPPEPQARLRGGDGDQRHPGLALSDLGTIFHTIERLTLKLSRLKVSTRPGLPAPAPAPRARPPRPQGRSLRLQDMERAHRELLRSLGEESSGGATPVGSFHSEAAGWTDSSLSPPAKGPLPSDCRGAGPCPAEGECSWPPCARLGHTPRGRRGVLRGTRSLSLAARELPGAGGGEGQAPRGGLLTGGAASPRHQPCPGGHLCRQGHVSETVTVPATTSSSAVCLRPGTGWAARGDAQEPGVPVRPPSSPPPRPRAPCCV